jgi:hypothetical protein
MCCCTSSRPSVRESPVKRVVAARTNTSSRFGAQDAPARLDVSSPPSGYYPSTRHSRPSGSAGRRRAYDDVESVCLSSHGSWLAMAEATTPCTPFVTCAATLPGVGENVLIAG